MKLSLVCASVVAFGVLTGSVFAASPAIDTSSIKSIDMKAHQLTLADGKMFEFPKTWKLKAFKEGQKVKVNYRDHMGSMMVTRLRHTA